MAQPAPGWHPEDIKAAIRKKHGTLRALATNLGYSKSVITKVIADPRQSRQAEIKIANDLGVKPHLLWPDRWSATGTALSRPGDDGPITRKSQKSCQKEEAA